MAVPFAVLRRFAPSLASLVAVLVLVSAGLLRAQLSSTATISGTVTDSTGAVVPNATVMVTDEATNVTTTHQTNGQGGFVFPGLPVDTYKISVKSSGFAPYTESGVVLHPGITEDRDVKLQPSSASEQVVVDATETQVETVTPEVSSDVSSAQVSTLPLNGRNYGALAAVMPGVQNLSAGTTLGTGGRATSNVISVNGSTANTTFYALDGMWDENTGNMNAVAVLPNPDSIEEVRVFQNDYSVRYSLMGASVVMLQTKSGGSSFHGNAWEYLRNDDLNARNYFSTTVPTWKENIYGYNLGGPFFIPHHYNSDRQKTFFFWNQQWVQWHQGLSLTGTTLTSDQRNGLITSSTPVKNPATGLPFSQNAAGQYVITPLNPNSVALANAIYPLPNYSKGSLNYINNKPAITNQRDDEIKVDHHFNSRYSLTAEYLDERQNYIQSSLNGATGGEVFNTNWEQDNTNNQLGQVSLTELFGNNIVNTTSISTNLYVLDLNLAGTAFVNQVPGFNETLPYNGYLANRIPSITISGGISPEGMPNSRPLTHAGDLDDSIGDNISWLKGKQFFQAGINLVFNTKRQNINTSGAAGTNGGWGFTGTTTGNAVADFMLGYAASFTQSSDQRRMEVHALEVTPYIEDRINVSRKLTATVGWRMFHMPLPHSPDTETIFSPSTYSATQAPTISPSGVITSTSYNALNGLITNGVNSVPQNFSNAHNWYFGVSAGFAYDVFGNGKTSIRGGYGLAHTRIFTGQDCSFNCGNNPPNITSVNLVNPRFPNATSGSAGSKTIQTLANADLNNEASQINSFSLGVQHEFPGNWIASVTGAGSNIRHLLGNWNYNQPLPTNGYDFNPNINTGSYSPYYYAPYIGYAAISTLATRQGSNWTALEASLKHAVSRNVFFTLAYTWSHGLSNYSTATYNMVDAYHPSRYYGNTGGVNIPQSGSATVIWTMPWFKSGNFVERTLLGGWKLSDITNLRSGASLDPGLSVSNQGYATRPDRVVGQSIAGPKTAAQWFNVNAFAAPAAGYIGNANLGVIRGPGLVDFDMALYKDFPIWEKHTIEFRGEAFNVFNHTNFSGVSVNKGASTFGQITNALDPRIFEVALRYQF